MEFLGSFKDNQNYSNALLKLLTYLLNNSQNLNQHSLVRPYRLIQKLDSKYHGSIHGITVYTKIKMQMPKSDKYGSFALDGWSYQDGLCPAHLSIGHKSNSIVIGINKDNLTLYDSNYILNDNNISGHVENPHKYVFTVHKTFSGQQVTMMYNHRHNFITSDVVDCFTGFVLVLKSIVDKLVSDKQPDYD